MIYFFINFKKLKKRVGQYELNFLLFIASASLSFIFLTTFFIVDLYPLVLAQPLRPRYLVILLPFAYMFIFIGFYNFKFTFQSSTLIKICYTVLAIIALLVYRPDLHRASLKDWNLHYKQLAMNLPPTICVPVNDSKKWIVENIWYFPNTWRNKNYRLIEKSKLVKTDQYWIKGAPKGCDLKKFELRIKN